jgi:hypothetical protein
MPPLPGPSPPKEERECLLVDCFAAKDITPTEFLPQRPGREVPELRSRFASMTAPWPVLLPLLWRRGLGRGGYFVEARKPVVGRIGVISVGAYLLWIGLESLPDRLVRFRLSS